MLHGFSAQATLMQVHPSVGKARATTAGTASNPAASAMPAVPMFSDYMIPSEPIARRAHAGQSNDQGPTPHDCSHSLRSEALIGHRSMPGATWHQGGMMLW